MSRLAVRVIDSFDDLRALEAEWWRLWRACPAATPFQSPAWLIPWWDVFAPGTLAVHAVYACDELVGLSPLYHERGEGSGRLLPVGISLSDYGDMLVQPDAGDVPGALSAAFAKAGLPITLVDLPPDAAAHAVPAPMGWRDETGAGEPCPVLPLAGAAFAPGDAPSCVPAPRRRKLRMAQHRAERRGGIVIATEADFAPANFLDALVRLHGERWKSRGEMGVLHDEAVLRFHTLALPRLVAAGLADLRLLSIGGELAGAYLGLRDEGRSYAYVGGMDPAFARESPGAIFLNAALCDAVARGGAEFHFLRGSEPYKYEWGAADRSNSWRTLSPPAFHG